MRRSLLITLILGLLAASCASSTISSPGTAVPQPPPPTDVLTPTPDATKVADLPDYVASDPALVGTTGRPQFVQFFAFWCTTCQAMRPMIHSLQDEYGLVVDFVYLDIDAANTKTLQQKLTFTGLRPTIIFLDASGQEKTRLVGEHTKEEFLKELDNLLAVGG
jgi:thiol-disulfide isomerase/thioredoxin